MGVEALGHVVESASSIVHEFKSALWLQLWALTLNLVRPNKWDVSQVKFRGSNASGGRVS